jgi:tripartite ATP-independent transporter DctM subunit
MFSNIGMILDLLMMIALCTLILLGVPVVFILTGCAVAFAALGMMFGVFDLFLLGALAQRLFGTMTSEVLIAIPLFIFMGMMLEKSKIAPELLEAMGRLFGSVRGGLAVSVSIVGALLAASTGIVGATVVTMGLIALPAMMRRGYDPAFASGSVCAAGTLGQIIPPSTVMVILGEVLASAYQQAQLAQGKFSIETISVGQLFAGSMIPGLMLAGLYIAYQLIICWLRPDVGPAIPRAETVAVSTESLIRALAPPIVLIIAVLGSILGGVATPTEAAAVGAVGATLLAGLRIDASRPWPIYAAGVSAAGLVLLGSVFDMRIGRQNPPLRDIVAMVVSLPLVAALAWGVVVALVRFRLAGIAGGIHARRALQTWPPSSCPLHRPPHRQVARHNRRCQAGPAASAQACPASWQTHAAGLMCWPQHPSPRRGWCGRACLSSKVCAHRATRPGRCRWWLHRPGSAAAESGRGNPATRVALLWRCAARKLCRSKNAPAGRPCRR